MQKSKANLFLFSNSVQDGSWDERFTPLEEVLENRRKTCAKLGIDPGILVFADQQHGTNIAVVEEKDLDHEYYGSTKITRAGGVDALITQAENIFLVTVTADCVPVFFYDAKKQVVGIAHCGWRGMLAELPRQVIRTFQEKFDSHQEDIHVSIGPSIRVCCYNVESAPDNRIRQFQEKFGPEVVQNRYLDLQKALEIQMQAENLPSPNLNLTAPCTACHPGFFSYYREKSNLRGQQAHLVGLSKIKKV